MPFVAGQPCAPITRIRSEYRHQILRKTIALDAIAVRVRGFVQVYFDNGLFTRLRQPKKVWRILNLEEWNIRLTVRIQHHVTFFGVMKQAFGGQHFDTIDDLFMGVEGFLGGLYADSLQTVFQE
jgi:hypothetical protein